MTIFTKIMTILWPVGSQNSNQNMTILPKFMEIIWPYEKLDSIWKDSVTIGFEIIKHVGIFLYLDIISQTNLKMSMFGLFSFLVINGNNTLFWDKKWKSIRFWEILTIFMTKTGKKS